MGVGPRIIILLMALVTACSEKPRARSGGSSPDPEPKQRVVASAPGTGTATAPAEQTSPQNEDEGGEEDGSDEGEVDEDEVDEDEVDEDEAAEGEAAEGEAPASATDSTSLEVELAAFAMRPSFQFTGVGDVDNRRPQPVLDMSRDPSTYEIPPFVPGGGRPRLPSERGGIAVALPPKWQPMPKCQAPFPRREIARDLPWIIDGDLGEWGMRGLVGYDQRDDGVHGEPGMDLHFFWIGETDDSWYFAGRLGGPWVEDPTGNRVLRIKFDGTTADRQFDYRAGMLGMTVGSGIQAFPADKAEIAVAGASFEMRIAKDQLVGYGDLRDVDLHARDRNAERNDTISFVPRDITDEVYTCPVRRPDGRLMFIRLLPQDDTTSETAERTMRAAMVAVPEVEHVLQDAPSSNTLAVIVRSGGPAGLCCGSTANPAMKIAAVRNRDSSNELSITAHEYGHLYNLSVYGLPSALVEPHSDLASMRVNASYWGPLSGYRSIQRRSVNVLKNEAASGVAYDVTKAGTSKSILLLHLVVSRLGIVPFREIMRERAETGVWTGVSGFLEAVKSSAAFDAGATETWSGWANEDVTYAGSSFPLVPLIRDDEEDGLMNYIEREKGTDPGNPDTDGDGLSDAFEVGYDLDPLAPSMSALKGLAADGVLGDWEQLFPDALGALEAPKALPDGCGSWTRILRAGAAFDGEFVLAAADLAEAPPVDVGMRLRVDLLAADGTGARVLHARGSRDVEAKGPAGSPALFSYEHIRPFAAKTVEVPIHMARLSGSPDQVRILTEAKNVKGKWITCHATSMFAPHKTR